MATTQSETRKTNRKIGVVVSDKMNKTISVKVSRLVMHKKYKKYYTSTSVFKAHDEKQSAKIGDKVMIQETRPLSKSKRWKLIKVIEAAKE